MKISCIVSPILPPGTTMLFGRLIHEFCNIDSRYWKSMPLGFAKRITTMLSSALGMSFAMNGFEVSTVGTRWKFTCVRLNCGRQISLITAGGYFLVYAKRLIGTLKDADDAMARFKSLESGVLSVGLVSTAKYFVPHLLANFHKEYPGLDMQLQVSANRKQLVDMLYAEGERQSGVTEPSVGARFRRKAQP